MHRLRFLALGALVVGAQMARAEQDYAKAIPDLANILCDFRAVTDPPIPAIAVEIRRSLTEGKAYIWLQPDVPPLPVLAIFSDPIPPETALTTVVSADANGDIGMISYQPSGAAVFSRHLKTAGHDIRWTAQLGHCTETKGA